MLQSLHTACPGHRVQAHSAVHQVYISFEKSLPSPVCFVAGGLQVDDVVTPHFFAELFG